MNDFRLSSHLSSEVIREAIRQEYASVAGDPNRGYHFHTGREAATRIGYDEALYAALPEANVTAFAGTGNPFALGPLKPGDVVVDAGSGAGFDALIAARLVGASGRVVGVDMTPAMLALARAGAETMGTHHVEFVEGYADNLPLPDNFADVIISNGVLNLTPDKEKTLKDWVRVLKPGGRLYMGDILIAERMPQEALDDVSLWTGWIAGGLPEADLMKSFRDVGFEAVEIRQRHNIFEGVPNPSSALDFGTVGISLRARKKERYRG